MQNSACYIQSGRGLSTGPRVPTYPETLIEDVVSFWLT